MSGSTQPVGIAFSLAEGLISSMLSTVSVGGTLAICGLVNHGLMRIIFSTYTKDKREFHGDNFEVGFFSSLPTGFSAILLPVILADAHTDPALLKLSKMSYSRLQMEALSVVAGSLIGIILIKEAITRARVCDKQALLAGITADMKEIWTFFWPKAPTPIGNNARKFSMSDFASDAGTKTPTSEDSDSWSEGTWK